MKKHLSYSALSQFKKSPNHLLAYWNGDNKTSDAMQFGSLVHKLLLQPESFGDEFSVFEGSRRAGKVWQEFKKTNQDKTIIKQSELDAANNILNNAMNHEVVKTMLANATDKELQLNWKHKGVDFKGFADLITTFEGNQCVVDIKTTSDAGNRFYRDLYYNDYKMQLAMYQEQFSKECDAYIIAIETTSPFNVQVYKLDESLLFKGWMDYDHYTQKFTEWNGKPQGYSKAIIEVATEIEEII
jgi:exodeoxyribonuclease VIII